MGARNEVENYITGNWQDRKVARWIINNLPLLEKGFTCSPCPVFTLSFKEGLRQKGGTVFEDFKKTSKIVMSGGFEGTKGHMWAVSEMREVRALTADINTPFVLMLEPDSYVVRQKGRQPIVDIGQREQLWSTSGLVDVVILLPEKGDDVSDEEHYLQIHRQIAPALWCANVENPHWLEIINRIQADGPLDIIRLFKHRPEPHISFLDSTKDLSAKEVKKAIYQYILGLVRDTDVYQVSYFLKPEEMTAIILKEMVRGL